MTPEGQVKAKLKQHLKQRKAYWFMPVQAGYGSNTLDFLVCMNGMFVGLECKRPGEKLTPRQEVVANWIKTSGGKVLLVSEDKEGALTFKEI
jgi:hypothetical protein